MHSIEKKALETYKINLYYFSKEHVEIHKKITLLEQAIQNGSYTEKYALEYKNGYFDILELSSGHYLYNQDSIKHAKELAKNVNYKKSDSVIEGFYNVRINPDEFKSDKIHSHNSRYAEAEIIHYNASVTSKNDGMKNILKFIFCGVGLGFHMTEIEKKINSSIVFIMEDNLEMFRLSLFTTDYQKLSKQALLFFSIMDNEYKFDTVFKDFFTSAYTHNHYIKYALFSPSDTKKVKLIQNSIVRSRHLIRPYSKHLRELLKAPEYLVERYPFVDMSKIHSLNSPFFDKPVLLIASGPSLGHNALWLQQNKDKFFIIAVLSSVLTLHKLGVKPDIVTHIDSDNVSIKLFKGINKDEFFDKTIFLFSSVISRNVADAVPKENLYCFETASNYKKNSQIPAAPSIGESTYAISLILGANELYLLGLDLALDPETKSTHSKEHLFSRAISESLEKDEQYTSLHNTIFPTKGNFLKEVPTTALYNLSVEGFGVMTRTFLTENQKIYNLNNGAFLEGALPLHVEDLDTKKFKILDKEKKFNQIKLFLDKISERNISESEIDNITIQIEEAQRLFKLVESFKQSIHITSYEQYLKDFYALYRELLNLDNTPFDINEVLSLYLQLIIGYIFDIFNTKELKNEKIHLKNINDIYIKQLEKILDLYLKTMRVYKEWAVK